MKIAIIDDEADIREIIRELLEMDGYDIVEADNGVTGLEVIRNSSPDLIISDIRMPEMTGDELFDELRRSDSEHAMIPFIFLSGNANEQEQIKRLNKGADNCFEKPIDLALLAAHVNSQLSCVTRVSDFLKRKFDRVAGAFPQNIQHDFSACQSLTHNATGYVDVIISAVHELNGCNCWRSATAGETTQYFLPEDKVSSRLNYIKLCLDKFEHRRQLVRSANGEDLSWMLIFMVAQAELEGRRIFVSDLYVSITSAKSTINARITSLIEDDVLIKMSDLTDGRRQLILLTDTFRPALTKHVDNSVDMIVQTS